MTEDEPQPLLLPEDRAFLHQHGWDGPEETQEEQAQRYETLAAAIPDPKLSRAYGQAALTIRTAIQKELDRIEWEAYRAEAKRESNARARKERRGLWGWLMFVVYLAVFTWCLTLIPGPPPDPPAPPPPPRAITCKQVSDTINEFQAKVFPVTSNAQVYTDAWAQLTKEYHETMGC